MKNTYTLYLFFLAIFINSCSNNENPESFKGVLFTDVNGFLMGTSDVNDEDWKFNIKLASKIDNLFPSKLDTGVKIDSLYILAYPNPNDGLFFLNLYCKQNSKLNLVLVDENLNILFKSFDINLSSGYHTTMVSYKVPSNKPILRLYYQLINNNKETKGFGDIQSI
jgi:hypothetical protein